MATVVKKTNPMNFRVSANTPDFPPADWLIDPSGFPTLYGTVPPKYWKLTAGGDDIEEMTAGEKVAVDAAESTSAIASAKASADAAIDGLDGYQLRAVAKLMIDEINVLRTWLRDFQSVIAAANNLSDVKTGVASLSGVPDRNLAQAKAAYKTLISGTDLDE